VWLARCRDGSRDPLKLRVQAEAEATIVSNVAVALDRGHLAHRRRSSAAMPTLKLRCSTTTALHTNSVSSLPRARFISWPANLVSVVVKCRTLVVFSQMVGR
jgi:hypothetical protein